MCIFFETFRLRYFLFRCDNQTHGDAWAVSSVSNRSAWAECHGGLYLDLSKYQHMLSASSPDSASESSEVGVAVYTKWPAKCLAKLPNLTAASDSHRKEFSTSADTQLMACWLARYFGPQSARAKVTLTLAGDPRTWTAWSLDSSALQALLTGSVLLSSSADCGALSSRSETEGKIMLFDHRNCTVDQAHATGIKLGASGMVVVVSSLDTTAAASMSVPVLLVDASTMSELALSQSSTPKLTARPVVDKTDVYLPSAAIEMESDIIVTKGTNLNLVGANTTLLVGPWAVYVPKTAALNMAVLTLKASIESPAVWVEGILSAESCVFTNCTAGLTSFHVLSQFAFSGPAVLKLFAPPPPWIFSKVKLNTCTLTENSVQGAGFVSFGSVALMGGQHDTLELAGCTVSHNVVSGTGLQLMGAIVMDKKSSFVMSDSAMIGNRITGFVYKFFSAPIG